MAASDTLGQSDIDAMLATLRPTLNTTDLPKGMTMTTLARVSATVRDAERAMSRLGASRIDRRLQGHGPALPREPRILRSARARYSVRAHGTSRGGIRLARIAPIMIRLLATAWWYELTPEERKRDTR
jgi:hypothetical protein